MDTVGIVRSEMDAEVVDEKDRVGDRRGKRRRCRSEGSPEDPHWIGCRERRGDWQL